MSNPFVQERLNEFYYWIEKREQARVNKEAGKPKPWTDEPILQTTRFCNIRRMDDKVSKWLLEEWYAKGGQTRNQLLANAGMARLINWPDSLVVMRKVGLHKKWSRGGAIMAMQEIRANGKLFTGAYIINGLAGQDKITTVADQFEALYTAPYSLVNSDSMQETHKNLQTLNGFGSFIAGQVVADLRHVMKGTWSDRNRWAPRGPGSQRGMSWLTGWNGIDELSKMNQGDFEVLLKALIIELSKSHVWPIVKAKGLEAHDIQNCLCETDKFLRLKYGTGRGKNKFDGA